jgi:hypothetical protein
VSPRTRALYYKYLKSFDFGAGATGASPAMLGHPLNAIPMNAKAVAALAVALGLEACAVNRPGKRPEPSPMDGGVAAAEAALPRAAAPRAALSRPVPLWADGRAGEPIDALSAEAKGELVLDLGESWVPYIFTEREGDSEPIQPNAYRSTYLALARGDIPDDPHDPYFAPRARRDRYHELYGIVPTLGLLRKRFEQIDKLGCDRTLDAAPLAKYRGLVAYRDNAKAKKDAALFAYIEKRLEAVLAKQGVDDPDKIDPKSLSVADRAVMQQYQKVGPAARAVRAAQARLRCEGYFEGKGKPVDGALDWSTNEALAEFERRHRVFGWGFLSKDTMAALQLPGMELERQAVVRVLTERAMHAAGFVEDGSTELKGKPRTFQGADGKEHPLPNLEHEIRDAVVKAFGLETPAGALAWLKGLGEPPEQKLVAIKSPPVPEYHDRNMKLSVEIDRGDVWYTFPYDEQGKEVGQGVAHRPHLTLYTEYRGQKIPLVYYNTTIGGWRSENIDGTLMWKYKNSPVGPRVWKQIVASPVWMPPPGTPARDLLKPGPDGPHVNYLEIGPGYASAYGLVAAYHLYYREKADGTLDIGGDEGIRTHGSVDYMSILERHSHGCHRLYNHLAVRMMSFVLRHRPHHRDGQQKLGYRLPLEQDDKEFNVEIDKGGYVFDLDEPVFVNVLPGRLLGRATPIETPIPKYDEKVGAYVTPDGKAVKVDRLGNMTPIPMPVGDGGAPDGGGP